jgi:hypothetical protein
MIPYNLPRGTHIVCVDDESASGLRRGKVYLVGAYSGRFASYVHLLHPDGRVDPDGCVDRRWYRNRFDVAKSPDGADYQAADDVDLVNH